MPPAKLPDARGDFPSDDEVTLAGRTVCGEGRGEPWEGKLGIAYTIRNRRDDGRHGTTIRAVVLRRAQFSCFNPADPNRPIVAEPDTHAATAFGECLRAASAAFCGRLPDPTHGATHYLTRALYDSPACPGWAKEPQVVISAELGHHVFLRGVRW